MAIPTIKQNWDAFVQAHEDLDLANKARKTKEFLIKHREKIEVGFGLASTLYDFAIYKSPFAIVKGLMNTANEVAKEGGFYSWDIFSKPNGWEQLFDARSVSLSRLLQSSLKDHPCKTIGFKYDSAKCNIYTVLGCEVVFIERGRGWDLRCDVHYRGSEKDKKAIIDFLVAEKIKQLNSPILTLIDTKEETDLRVEPINPQPSKRADEYVVYFKKAFDMGINRSLMLFGQPGSGKTSLSHTIVKNLGLKTLIYKDDTYAGGLEVFLFVVEKFGIEAVILDDFDQVPNSAKLLGVLEKLNRQVKLVIALANTLKDMHSALLRPQRMDERELINTMEEEVIHNVLDDLDGEYFELVKEWPIAFIQELVKRAKLRGKENLTKHYEELKDRVEKQLKDISPDKKDEKKDEDDAEEEDE